MHLHRVWNWNLLIVLITVPLCSTSKPLTPAVSWWEWSVTDRHDLSALSPLCWHHLRKTTADGDNVWKVTDITLSSLLFCDNVIQSDDVWQPATWYFVSVALEFCIVLLENMPKLCNVTILYCVTSQFATWRGVTSFCYIGVWQHGAWKKTCCNNVVHKWDVTTCCVNVMWQHGMTTWSDNVLQVNVPCVVVWQRGV